MIMVDSKYFILVKGLPSLLPLPIPEYTLLAIVCIVCLKDWPVLWSYPSPDGSPIADPQLPPVAGGDVWGQGEVTPPPSGPATLSRSPTVQAGEGQLTPRTNSLTRGIQKMLKAASRSSKTMWKCSSGCARTGGRLKHMAGEYLIMIEEVVLHLSHSGYSAIRNVPQLCALNLSTVTLMTYQAGCFKLG